jgi:hypothetical protein
MVEMENINGLVHSRPLDLLYSSVPDPDSRRYRYSSESGSDSQRYSSGSGSRPGSFHDKAKTVRRTLFPAVLWLYDLLSLKNDVNVASKRNKQNSKFLLASWRSLRKRAGSGAGFGYGSASPRIRIRTTMSRIRIPEHCKFSGICLNHPLLGEFGTIVHSQRGVKPIYKKENKYI